MFMLVKLTMGSLRRSFACSANSRDSSIKGLEECQVEL
jgi:hypothetical protein